MTFEELAGGTGAAAVFGDGASASAAYGLLTVDVPATSWVEALTAARDVLGCTYFDWLSAVDEPGEGFYVAAHLVAVGKPLRHLLVRTRVPHDAPALPTATGVYAGAAWHERETHEMFGVDFPGHPYLAPLLLPEGFEGHPLRKEFVLAARVAKAWPGAKEPGESEHGGPKRRQMLPPGVPDPNEWGPMKGRLAPEPARERPTRPAGTDRPRRARSAVAGTVSQSAQGAEARPSTAAPSGPKAPGTQEPGRDASGAEERRSGSARTGAAGSGGRTPQPPVTGSPAPQAPSPGVPAPEGAKPHRGTPDAPWQQAEPESREDQAAGQGRRQDESQDESQGGSQGEARGEGEGT